MGHAVCCVINCKNTCKNKSVKFYRFPTSSWKLQQKEKWIAAIQKANSNNSWYPKSSQRICSEHFIGNKKSENQYSPSYIPTIFPLNKPNETSRSNRDQRFLKVRMLEKIEANDELPVHDSMESTTTVMDFESVTINNQKILIDQGCQVDDNNISECNQPSKTFICNRYIYNNCYADVEIQTEITETGVVKISNNGIKSEY